MVGQTAKFFLRVTPAKAGVHCATEMDARFSGNDDRCGLGEGIPHA